jgi:hypothetical protein
VADLGAAVQGASNRLIDVEDLSEEDLKVLREFYRRLSEMSKTDVSLGTSHSLDEAQQRHELKRIKPAKPST